jgi:predicted RNA-binding protein associated with RNAse of E/G family
MEFVDNVWKGDDLLLKIKVFADWSYKVEGDAEFTAAVDGGWMHPDAAMNARDTIRKMCVMLNDRTLPPEVMDAVNM